jgi:hypothetical protein
VFDTEDDGRGGFLYGAIAYRDKAGNIVHMPFWSRETMAQAFERPMFRGYWFWAHNLLYDLRNIWGLDFPGKKILVKRQVYSAYICIRDRSKKHRKSREYIRFCDSTKHYPASLKKIGESIGSPKIDLACHPRDLSKENLSRYCNQDCTVLLSFLEALQDGYNELGSSLNATIGSTALELYRRRYQSRSYLQIDRADLETLSLAYFGGRCEAFYLGSLDGPLYMGDVNSMYPSVMRSLTVPIADRRNLWRRKMPDSFVLSLEGASLCNIYVPEMFYPPLPYKRDKKLLFPIGNLTGWWTHNEIRYALSLGCKLDNISESIWFDASCKPWEEFVSDVYAFRMQGGFRTLVGKLVGNNLYGKHNQCNPSSYYYSPSEFATRLEREKRDTEYISIERDNQGNAIAFIVDGTEREYPKHSNMIWGAYITAGARIRLHQELVTHRALYCDTDSCLTRDELLATPDLGGLSLKCPVCHCEIKGPKCYQLDNAYTVKGVPKRAGKMLQAGMWIDIDDCKEAAFHGGMVAYETPTRLMEPFVRQSLPTIVDGQWIDGALPASSNMWSYRKKQLRFLETKRIVIGPNRETLPLTFKDW